MQRKTLLAALIATLSGTACQAHAYSVTVVASRPVEEQVIPRMEAIKDVLGNILSTQTATGTAINQNSEKLASVIAQNGQATRQQMIFSNETQRLEEARKSFTVPDSICSESASGIATESKSASASAASKLSKGGGVSNRSLRDRLASAANSPVRELMMARPYTPVTVQKQNMHVLEEPPFVLLWAKYQVETVRYARFTTAQVQRTHLRH